MNNSSAKKLSSKEKTLKAYQLRLQNKTYQEIGDALGMRRQSAFERVQKHIQLLDNEIDETGEQVKAMELERLDLMQAKVWDSIAGEKINEETLGNSIDRMLRLMTRRAALLGLDAPKKHANADGDDLFQAFIDAVENVNNKGD